MVYRHYLSEYRKTPNGVILAPVQIGRWLVVFCDEINLPAQDKYGTQRVISFLRQLVECVVTGVLVTRPGSSWTIVIQLYHPILKSKSKSSIYEVKYDFLRVSDSLAGF